ncbi:hypothetical protein RND15_42515 [Streptomyces sp. DSM 41529]|uniref:Uncharacterized protein n=1 Tax=Streptomyces lonegramiae TaxID=3075524 RepID=A0ABU2XTR1_9ACTN|nr:hypothetical protein [Streptomyces sp. DSM 41529]
MLLGINWRLHFGALGSAEELKESLRQISPISPSGRWRRGKAIHSSCISKSAAETNRMVRQRNNGDPPTGNIWMEREPEAAYYRALFGQDFGVVG